MSPFRLLALFLLFVFSASAATLNIPPRPTNALSGQQFVKVITSMAAPPDTQRENWIYAQIASGNVPNFMRTLVTITTNATVSGTPHTVTYYVTPDYMAIGSDADYFLTPMTPLLAQRLDNLLGTIRPTRKMVDQIANRAVVHLQPNPIPPDPNMITVPYFNQHNTMVWTQRVATLAAHPLGSLVDGDKKDVIIAPKIYTNFANSSITKVVVIYGWHYPDGTFIQPEYNGHEETYADYSHGIRMVQNAIIFDGTNTTISAVLTNPAIAAVLSDETTYTGNVIQKPFYTVAAVAPSIITHPSSRAVGPGTNVQFSVLSVGDQTLTYTWKQNGSAISGATNSVLTINNAQTANAGTYTVVVANSSGTATSWNATLTVEPTRPILFADDFETNSSANWNIFAGSDNANLDYSVTWAYDYGSISYSNSSLTRLIPPAPHSAGSTKGVKLTVNTTNGANTGVNIYPKNETFSGNFALKFDMWINYPGAANGAGATGSTQHGIFGINHTGTRANWAAASASATDGLWFGCDGDGGTSRDYRAYRGNTSGTQVELIGTAASGLTFSNHAATVYQNLFRVPPYESAGSPGKGWVSVEVDQTNNNLVVLMNGTVIAQRTNTSVFTNGTIMLGLMDVFPSLASPVADSYIIFDNVTVEDLNPQSQTPTQLQSIAVNPDNTITTTWSTDGSSNYTLQYKTNLTDANWTALNNYTANGSTLSANDAPLNGSQRFYQLASSGHTSDIAGVFNIPLLGNSDTFVSLPLLRSPSLVATVSSTSGNIVTVTGSPWTTAQFVYATNTQPNTYYARFISGALAGRLYPVTDNTANTVTLNLGTDSLTSAAPNDQLAIEPYWTLASAFPNGNGINISPTPGNRNTEILIPDRASPGINLSAAKVYYFNAGTWKQVGAGSVNHNDDILPPDQHFIVRHNVATNTTLTVTGLVLTNPFAISLPATTTTQQDNPLGLPHPAAMTLNESALITSGAFNASPLPGTRTDELLTFDNSAVQKNKSASSVYYYWSNAWRRVGSGSTDVGSSQFFTPGTALLLRKSTNSPASTWLTTPNW